MHADAFQHDGFVILPDLLDAAALGQIDAHLTSAAASTLGARQMLQLDWCAALADRLAQQMVAANLMPAGHIGVQCTCFDKSRDHNWLVAPHQDLSIPVARRSNHPALSGWSEKDGMLFVQPPAAVLADLVALRLHIDDCAADDGALNVIPGSHERGRLRGTEWTQLRSEQGEVLCPVPAGGGMVMRPLLVHASSKATGKSRRRVLHFLFGPEQLPFGLRWR